MAKSLIDIISFHRPHHYIPCGYNVDEINEYAFSFLMQQSDGQRLL
jgi:hypothetical protein